MVCNVIRSFSNLVSQNFTRENVQQVNFLQNTPKLEVLVLDDCSNLNRCSFQNHVVLCHSLKILQIKILYHFTKYDIPAVTQHIPNLEFLQVVETDHLPWNTAMASFAIDTNWAHSTSTYFTMTWSNGSGLSLESTKISIKVPMMGWPHTKKCTTSPSFHSLVVLCWCVKYNENLIIKIKIKCLPKFWKLHMFCVSMEYICLKMTLKPTMFELAQDVELYTKETF